MSGRNWTGTVSYNYFVNLAQVLAGDADDRVQAVFFGGMDAIASRCRAFCCYTGSAEVIRHCRV